MGIILRFSASKVQIIEPNGNILSNQFYTLFHKDGTLIDVFIKDASRAASLYPSYNSKSTFDFKIESIDEVDKAVQITILGKLLKNDPNNTGNIIYEDVSGVIFLPFGNLNPNLPSIANYETTCKINNQNWRGLGRLNQGVTNQYFIQIFANDEHSIELVLPTANLQVDTHTYSGGIAVFDDYSINYLKHNSRNIYADEDFITSGTNTVSEKGLGYVKGTFSFTSNNSNTNITITNGVFSEKIY